MVYGAYLSQWYIVFSCSIFLFMSPGSELFHLHTKNESGILFPIESITSWLLQCVIRQRIDTKQRRISRVCTVRALRRLCAELYSSNEFRFFFVPSFFLSVTEIFTLAFLRPEIGCRAIHHAANSAERQAHPSRMAACMRFPSTHTYTHTRRVAAFSTCMGMGMLPPKKPPPEERACGCGSLLPRRPNPSCTHAFLLRRCFLVVDAGFSNLRRKTVEERSSRGMKRKWKRLGVFFRSGRRARRHSLEASLFTLSLIHAAPMRVEKSRGGPLSFLVF